MRVFLTYSDARDFNDGRIDRADLVANEQASVSAGCESIEGVRVGVILFGGFLVGEVYRSTAACPVSKSVRC